MRFFLVKFDIYNEEGEILIQGALIETPENVSWAIRLLTIGWKLANLNFNNGLFYDNKWRF